MRPSPSRAATSWPRSACNRPDRSTRRWRSTPSEPGGSAAAATRAPVRVRPILPACSEVPVAAGGQLPGVLVEQLGDRAEDAALDEELLLAILALLQAEEPHDGQPVERDAPFVVRDLPPVDVVAVDRLGRTLRHFEDDALELGPEAAQVGGRGGDGEVELVEPRADRLEVRSGHGRPHAAAVAIAGESPGRARRGDTTGTRHTSIVMSGPLATLVEP